MFNSSGDDDSFVSHGETVGFLDPDEEITIDGSFDWLTMICLLSLFMGTFPS